MDRYPRRATRQKEWTREIRPKHEGRGQRKTIVRWEHEADALDVLTNDRSSLTVGRTESWRGVRLGHSRVRITSRAWTRGSRLARARRPRRAGSRTVRSLEEQNYRDRKLVEPVELAKLSATGKTSSEAAHAVQEALRVIIPRGNLRYGSLLRSLLYPLSRVRSN